MIGLIAPITSLSLTGALRRVKFRIWSLNLSTDLARGMAYKSNFRTQADAELLLQECFRQRQRGFGLLTRVANDEPLTLARNLLSFVAASREARRVDDDSLDHNQLN